MDEHMDETHGYGHIDEWDGYMDEYMDMDTWMNTLMKQMHVMRRIDDHIDENIWICAHVWKNAWMKTLIV